MSEYHKFSEKKRPKFLVSWIEAPDFIRGQTVMDRAEASKLMKHLQELDTTLYAEVRRIGSKLGSYQKVKQ